MHLAQLLSLTLHASYTEVENGASFAALGKDGTLYILFEWSRGAVDWKNNFDFPAVPYRDMPDRFLCHRGFLKVWKSAEPYIGEILRESTAGRIVISGYSHGGALAVLCHEYVWFTDPARRISLTGVGFGAPRVLWRLPGTLWPRKRWENFTVVRNVDDAVTHLPPALLGYRHVGNLLTIGEKGRYSPVDAHRPEAYERSLAEYVRTVPDPRQY